jgi:hypothetical protein
MSGTHIVTNVMSNDNELRTYLQNHPKTLSALFGLMVLLTQVGTVAAGNCRIIAGP